MVYLMGSNRISLYFTTDLEGESVAFAMLVVAVISVTIFLVVKKRNKKTEPKDFIQETE